MDISYSLHLSNKKNAITNSKKLEQALKHNLRAYKSVERDKGINVTLIGSKCVREALSEFRSILRENTQTEINEFNNTKTKKRDKIDDYYQKISNDRKTDLAAEIIIQVGDREFWQNKNINERKKMTQIFKKQLDKLNALCPEFKIVNATIHYDEQSPHIQIIGIPIAKYDKGLKVRVAKTKVFTQGKLEELQDKMRENILEDMQQLYDININLKAKSKGRNKDLLISEYKELKEEVINAINTTINNKKNELNSINKEIDTLKNTDKWIDAETIKAIDNSKKIIEPNLFNIFNRKKEKSIELTISQYNRMYKMSLDNSSKIEYWNNKSIHQEKEIERLKIQNEKLKTENEELEEKNIEYKNKNKILENTLYHLSKYLGLNKLINKIKEFYTGKNFITQYSVNEFNKKLSNSSNIKLKEKEEELER